MKKLIKRKKLKIKKNNKNRVSDNKIFALIGLDETPLSDEEEEEEKDKKEEKLQKDKKIKNKKNNTKVSNKRKSVSMPPKSKKNNKNKNEDSKNKKKKENKKKAQNSSDKKGKIKRNKKVKTDDDEDDFFSEEDQDDLIKLTDLEDESESYGDDLSKLDINEKKKMEREIEKALKGDSDLGLEDLLEQSNLEGIPLNKFDSGTYSSDNIVIDEE